MPPSQPLARRPLHWVSGIASHEWLLTGLGWANGGDVILLRSLLVALEVYVLALAARNGIDPARGWTAELAAWQAEVSATIAWLGPIFAGVYASLYSRYSAQWSYLAGVYNKIKETEARGSVEPTPMAQWKAGFIEDAEDLHLATKSMFASTIRNWSSDPGVEAQFKQFTDDGAQRWQRLMARIGNPPPALTGARPTERADAEPQEKQPGAT